MLCKSCKSTLTNDEIALYRRLVNRGATEYLCLECLSGWLSCEKQLLLDKIEEFRKAGCSLFAARR